MLNVKKNNGRGWSGSFPPSRPDRCSPRPGAFGGGGRLRPARPAACATRADARRAAPPPGRAQERGWTKSIPSKVGGDPETSLQKPASNSVANLEPTHSSRNDRRVPSATCGDRFPPHGRKEGTRRSARPAGRSLSAVTRDLVPKCRTYCLQSSICAEIIGLNKDMTSYKSTRFFLGSLYAGVLPMCTKLQPH